MSLFEAEQMEREARELIRRAKEIRHNMEFDFNVFPCVSRDDLSVTWADQGLERTDAHSEFVYTTFDHVSINCRADAATGEVVIVGVNGVLLKDEVPV